ncbi:ribosomal protein L2, related [Neospora caninum Liverpool]|uniref:Large ribosomal subunit protein uL2m n=1 Tax=Neospora caninum (strain Liverpool) TaxID=572307 RepID=F0V9H5_NEOCL|nr:ribosomal protein L2, related [Neospora caninum Liverpool]CBZ50400.1 ribosomal protein L2, related [Neospora caninum Liverpool]|eukprot:XP_003880434.1 ribosomal protein L2, related [Neospora caninum Liverpool]
MHLRDTSQKRLRGPVVQRSLRSQKNASKSGELPLSAVSVQVRGLSASYLPRAATHRNRVAMQLFETPRESTRSRATAAAREAAAAVAASSTVTAPFTLQKQQRLLSLLASSAEAAGASELYRVHGVAGFTRFLPSSSPRTSFLFRGRVLERLSCRRVNHLGRNHNGRITVRFRGAGHFRRIRFVDYKRGRKNIFGTVLRLEYDPNRSAHLALLQYDDGVLSYILATEATRPGDRLVASEHANISPGNCLPLRNIPVSTIVHNVELRPGAGGQLVRAGGCYATVVAKDKNFVTLKLTSTEVRRFSADCWATVGQVSNAAHAERIRGKAGVSYWLGERPRTRGKAMNPVDHPHGGGTGKKGLKRPPVSKWGILCKGYKTRAKKKPLGLIVRRKKANKLIKKFGELGA